MTQITTYTSSDGRVILLAEMPFTYLVNAINRRAELLEGGTDDVLEALRAELARRPPPDPNAPQPVRQAKPKTKKPAKKIAPLAVGYSGGS